jgi:3-dehydroquinate dehydratase/shikimate dehydrogenase
MDRVAVIASITSPLSGDTREIVGLPKDVTWIQLRADLVGDIPAEWLRSCFSGQLIYSLRSSETGGAFHGSAFERQRRLLVASRSYDLIELDASSDLNNELLNAIPPTKRMITWCNRMRNASEMLCSLERNQVPARFYLVSTPAQKTSDGVQALCFLKMLQRNDVCAFSDGPYGLWSRLLAPYFGSPFVFGRLNDADRSSGDLSVHQLISDYGLPVLNPVQKLFGMVGNKIFQSPSPRIHNCAYRALKYPALFLPFHVDGFEEFWRDLIQPYVFNLLGLPLEGFVMVSPHKEAALEVADYATPMAQKARATNVVIRRNGFWEAHTTDPESISRISPAGPIKAAVIGCGGAGRAVAAALQKIGAEVTLVNRSKERGLYASALLGLPFIPLSEFRASGYGLLVNATPIGKESDCLPFAVASCISNTLIVDLAYGGKPTPLVAAVRARGGTAIDGYDVLLTQVRKQFLLLTRKKMPESIGRTAIESGNAVVSRDSNLQHQPAQIMEAC